MVCIKPWFLKPANIFQMQDTSSNVSTSTALLQISNNLSSSFIPPIPLKGLVKMSKDYPHVKKYGKLDAFH